MGERLNGKLWTAQAVVCVYVGGGGGRVRVLIQV